MEDRLIETTNKETFLRSEFEDHFTVLFDGDFEDYKESMSIGALFCETCGTYYWEGCLKRCLCDETK